MFTGAKPGGGTKPASQIHNARPGGVGQTQSRQNLTRHFRQLHLAVERIHSQPEVSEVHVKIPTPGPVILPGLGVIPHDILPEFVR
jgi:hypothetical protein